MEDNIFQIDFKATNNSISISPNSVTFWMEMGIDNWKYILNTIMQNNPFLFFGLRLERGLK